MSETLREFCDRTDRETWNGASSAYRAGAKAALTGAECNYVQRPHLGKAWLRGNAAMLENLRAGAVVTLGEERRAYSFDAAAGLVVSR